MNTLKNFFYKIIICEAPTEVSEDVNLHERDLCFICKDDIDPTLKESITILNYKHFFHKSCIECCTNNQCPLCQEECIESTKLGNYYSQESTQGISTQLDKDLIIDSECDDNSEVQISRQARSIESLLNSEFDTSPIFITFIPTSTTTDITTSAPTPTSIITNITTSTSKPQSTTTDITTSAAIPTSITTNITTSTSEPQSITTDITTFAASITTTDITLLSISTITTSTPAPISTNAAPTTITATISSVPAPATTPTTTTVTMNTQIKCLIQELKDSNNESKAKKAVISSWYDFLQELENQINEKLKDRRLTQKTATSKVYNELLKRIPITQETLRKRVEKTNKVYKLFRAIGVDKIEKIKTTSYQL
ncbi:17916_t:CDS:2 [Racocetra fulgida]|uniref:17916_t:CDS:1 n=1 Tax=Racocetra fulgida TaxID=60492 RepID=A0A9N8W946_9GLOM|nr:17916_t:CDS:2 [Racocetra fulgida]